MAPTRLPVIPSCLIFCLSLLGVATVAVAEPPKVRSEMIVSTDWLADRAKDPKTVVLHVAKDKASYDAGHLPTARFLPMDELATTRADVPNELPSVERLDALFDRLGIGNESRVIIYGEMSGLFAARAYFTLDYLGHGDRVALLDGGIEKWRAEGRPLSTESPKVEPADFMPGVRPATVVGLDVMRDLSWASVSASASNPALLDARPPAEYAGTTPGDRVSRGGHIPGATNLFWMQNLVSKDNPVLRPAAELQKMYEAALGRPAGKAVVYCRTGAQSSHAYFTAKYLGYDVAMYDGSYVEWSNARGTPVVAGTQK